MDLVIFTGHQWAEQTVAWDEFGTYWAALCEHTWSVRFRSRHNGVWFTVFNCVFIQSTMWYLSRASASSQPSSSGGNGPTLRRAATTLCTSTSPSGTKASMKIWRRSWRITVRTLPMQSWFPRVNMFYQCPKLCYQKLDRQHMAVKTIDDLKLQIIFGGNVKKQFSSVIDMFPIKFTTHLCLRTSFSIRESHIYKCGEEQY